MKTKLLFATVFIASLAIGQKNQAEIAAEWTSGTYDWYYNDSYSGFDLKEGSSQTSLMIYKDDDGKVYSLKRNGNMYTTDTDGVSPFVRYFKMEDNYSLYFTSKYVVVFDMSQSEASIKLIGSIGGKMKEKVKDEIKEHLEKTREDQEEYMMARSYKGGEIESIDVKLLHDDELQSGSEFRVGVITTFTNGKELKSQNIGGQQLEDDYIIYVMGAHEYDDDNGGKYFKLLHCDEYSKPDYSKAEQETTFYVYVLENDYYEKELHSQAFKYTCTMTEKGLERHAEYLDKEKEKNYEAEMKKLYGSYSEIDFNDDIRVYERDGKFGFVTRDFKELTPPIYEKAVGFHDGYAQVKKNGKYGFIDKTGNEVVPVKYEEAYPYAYEGLFGVQLNGKQGYIDPNGKEVIPLIYDAVGEITGEKVQVKKDGKYGYFSTKGEVLIPFEYDFLAERFNSNGLLCARKGDKYGFIDINQNVKIPFNYSKCEAYFSEGMVKVSDGEAWGFINADGEEVLAINYQVIKDFKNGFARVKEFGGDRGSGLCGYINKSGEFITDVKYSDVFDFDKKTGFAKVAVKYGSNSYYGYINKSGTEVIPPVWEKVGEFKHGYATVKADKRYGYVNESGTYVTGVKFRKAYEVSRYKTASVNFEGIDCKIKEYSGNKFDFHDDDKNLVKYHKFEGYIYVINDMTERYYIHFRSRDVPTSEPCDQVVYVQPGAKVRVPFVANGDVYYSQNGKNEDSTPKLLSMDNKNDMGVVYRLSKRIN